MSNIARFKPDQTPEYLQSVNTPDYEGDLFAIINPDLAAVQNVPLKYWKRNGNNIVEMSQSEKDAITAAELQLRKSQADNFGVGLLELVTALIEVINLRLPAGQKITKQEMIDAVKAEIT